MSPYDIMGWVFAAVIATIILVLLTPRRKSAAVSYGTDDGQADVHTPNLHISFENINPPPDERVTFGKRTVGKHPALGAPYSFDRHDAKVRKPTISLTPRQIERINTQRRLRGNPPFNRAGLTNAVAHPWDRYDVRQPQSTNDWLSYLIVYEILLSDHQSHTVGGCGGVTIDPNLPYNGQGGEFAGAGASGTWGDPITRTEAAAVEHGVSLTSDPAPDIYAPVAAAALASVSQSPTYAPDPSPSPTYSAPDPTPSYSSSSSDSSSSYSSSSSDSGSSGGGDSGGGGGGGD